MIEGATQVPASAARAQLAYALRPYARDRVARCRCRRVTPRVELLERYDGETGEARLVVSGVQTCGSVHSCPMCAASILAERANEITFALNTAERKKTALVTFTLRHHHAAPLPLLRRLLALSYSNLKAGRSGKEFKQALSYTGDLRAAEQTIGKKNGWHPHLHALWFSASEVQPGEWKHLISERWRTCVSNAYRRMKKAISKAFAEDFEHNDSEDLRDKLRSVLGSYYIPTLRNIVRRGETLTQLAQKALDDLRSLGSVEQILPDFVSGVDVEQLRDTAVGSYLAKLGLELASIDTKQASEDHLTSWALAQKAATADNWAVMHWREHSKAMFGARQLTWSRGLRDRLGLGEERTDWEICQEEMKPGDRQSLWGWISAEDWDFLSKKKRQELIAELHISWQQGTQPWFVQSAIQQPHRVPRLIDHPPEQPQQIRPPWWDTLQAHERAKKRGASRMRLAAEIADRNEAERWDGLVPISVLLEEHDNDTQEPDQSTFLGLE